MRMKTFSTSYVHDGRRWGLRFMARDFKDAEQRLAAIGCGRVEGMTYAAIPAWMIRFGLPGLWYGTAVVCLQNAWHSLRGR